MKIIIYVFLLAISALGAQAGKMNESGFRLYGGLYSGLLKSDFESRILTQSFLGGSIESAWNKTNAGGINLGGQFFLKSPQSQLSGFMFRYEIESVATDYTSSSIGSGFYSSNAYSLSQGRSDLSVGGVFNIANDFRFTPRFGIRALSQTLDSGSIGILSPGFIGIGGGSINTTNSGGYIGFLYEYDYKPGITFYADSIILSPFLLKSNGNYSYLDSGIILASNGYISLINSYSGTYSSAYSKLALGSSVEIAPKSRIFLQLESESIESKIKTNSALSLSSIKVDNQTSTGLSLSGATITSLLSNSGKGMMQLLGFRVGFSYDF